MIKMSQYRTQPKIIADILIATREMNSYGQEVKLTTLMRRCNISYSRMAKLLSQLLGSGLLQECNENKTYALSEKGAAFLRFYSQLEEFSQSFGLKL
jgi:predicted transcriptional regulator